MKIRRRIWSLPLVLVTALLLVGLFAASVLAQSVENDDVRVAIDGDESTLPTGDIAIVGIEGLPTTGTKGFVNLVEDNDATSDVDETVASPAIMNSPAFDHDDNAATPNQDLFAVEGTFQQSDGTAAINVSFHDSATGEDLTRDSYSLRIRAFVDENIGVDSGDDEDADNDRDHTFNATVTVNVVRVADDGLRFDVDPSKALKDSPVSQLGKPINGSALQWEVTGIGSGMKLVEIGQDTDVTDFEVRETPAGSGKFGLFVVTSTPTLTGTTDLTITLQFDEDVTVNANPPVDPNAVQDTEDTDPADDPDLEITLNGSIVAREGLAFTGDNLGNPETPAERGQLNADEEFHYEFTIASNTVLGHAHRILRD